MEVPAETKKEKYARIDLASDIQKELADKLAWAVGSTLRVPYATKRCPVHTWASRLSNSIYRAYETLETAVPGVAAVGPADIPDTDSEEVWLEASL